MRDRATPPTVPHYMSMSNTERDYERDKRQTRQLCLTTRAAKQQAGASPVTAVSIGSGSAVLGGYGPAVY